MSLMPYNHQEGREIVLRHRNAIVVRDSTSHRLEIRGLTECPTCRRPLGPSERTYERPYENNHDSYVNPDYFRMLQAGTRGAISSEDLPPSPVRRLFNPALTSGGTGRGRSSTPETESSRVRHDDASSEAEFISSTPGVSQPEGHRIRKQAFSPGYFRTFFKEERVLGKGGKGVVLLVRHEIDGCDLGYFACKRVPVGDDHDWLEKVLVEVGLLNKLSHPNLVSYRHVWLETYQPNTFGPSVACAFILQQYCNGGDLHQYIVGSGSREVTKEELKARARRRSKGHMETPQSSFTTRQLSFDEIFSLFKDITSGVAYLHSNEYIHRDLKPNNCLLHREGGRLRCLISDFGEVQPEHVVRKSSGSTGTISYCAPEVLKMNASGHYENFTTKSDIFSLGMILYFMCFGKLPYRSSNAIQEELEDIDELRDEITGWQGFHEERRERPDLPSHLYILLKKLLSLKPAERPSASEVLSAMRGEIHFENINRTERDQRSNLSLRVNRVQNLDSPATPSTPVNDPQEPLGRPRPSPLNNSQIVPSPSKFDQQSLALDDGSDQRHYSPIQTPEHPPAMTITETTDEENDGQSTQLNFETDARRPSRPLLMPPPTTRAAAFRHRISIMAQQTAELMGVDRDLPNHLFRLSFFFVKMVSLFRPCYPYMANWEIALPLVMIAVLDLRVPRASEDDALARRNAGDEIEFGVPPPPPFRGIGASVIFLLFHVAVLATASNWDALCAVSPNQEWSDWYMRSTIPSTFSSTTADLE
ncbi:unnamed protein product [Clonostachys rhizophaga]|uniref:non-specific serine/threonine protein kinase n=1 Tax=Clonostachys rhizophaga TaxID=160324 RepID=A0A9N9VF37_9HYPO|nr:unnamed protein product [Clonostachys rhizophaga]